MVNLAQAWAEEYHKLNPHISIQVSGGGSGVGIASLIDGVTDLANSSRKIKDVERRRAEQNSGKAVREFVVGLDALAIYVHRANPLEGISIGQLAEIFGEMGNITKWSQLGVSGFGCTSDAITRVSRQNNSGTYYYFREAILGNQQELKLGSIDQSGSKDVVALVANTPCAIGYSGMGYRTDEVKVLPVSLGDDSEGVSPSVETAADGTYPISRPLLVYVLDDQTSVVNDFIDWLLGPAGQQVVLELGYVPVALWERPEGDAVPRIDPEQVSAGADDGARDTKGEPGGDANEAFDR